MIPGFHRLPRHERCPVCGHKEWCLIGDDGIRVICQRAPSQNRWKDAGWLHYLDSPMADIPTFSKPESAVTKPDCENILQRYRLDTTTPRLERLSGLLGVTVASLRRIEARWSENHHAWAFPMRNAAGDVIGIRLRAEDGAKWAVRDSRQGLIIPRQLNPDDRLLLICEGPTDTAAMLDLGFNAIGRPSCRGCERDTAEFCRSRRAYPVIAANYDEPKQRPDGSEFYPGQEGAQELAARLGRCRIIYPPKHKDFRAWINAGGSAAAVQALIANARYVSNVAEMNLA